MKSDGVFDDMLIPEKKPLGYAKMLPSSRNLPPRYEK